MFSIECIDKIPQTKFTAIAIGTVVFKWSVYLCRSFVFLAQKWNTAHSEINTLRRSRNITKSIQSIHLPRPRVTPVWNIILSFLSYLKKKIRPALFSVRNIVRVIKYFVCLSCLRALYTIAVLQQHWALSKYIYL